VGGRTPFSFPYFRGNSRGSSSGFLFKGGWGFFYSVKKPSAAGRVLGGEEPSKKDWGLGSFFFFVGSFFSSLSVFLPLYHGPKGDQVNIPAPILG